MAKVGCNMFIEMKTKHRTRILRSRFLRIYVFPYRVLIISRHLSRATSRSLKWLIGSSEFTNFSYDVTSLNEDQMIWYVSAITGASFDDISGYFEELHSNKDLPLRIEKFCRSSRRGSEIDKLFLRNKRAAWYAFVRVLQPKLVVETGTDKGLGALIIAEALKKNGAGQLVTIDYDPTSGSLLEESDGVYLTHLKGNSLELLKTLDKIDLFIHECYHSPDHELGEYNTVARSLSENALVISGYSYTTNVLSNWSKLNNRKFLYFSETSQNHWYRGAGIGASFKTFI